MIRFAVICAGLLLLAACDRPEAPVDRGVCWRMHHPPGAKITYQAVGHDIDSLETCAVLLEAARLRGDRDSDGAFQGNFILIDDAAIRAGQTLDGFHYPIFQPPQRASIDKDLRGILKSHGGKMPSPDDLGVVRQ